MWDQPELILTLSTVWRMCLCYVLFKDRACLKCLVAVDAREYMFLVKEVNIGFKFHVCVMCMLGRRSNTVWWIFPPKGYHLPLAEICLPNTFCGIGRSPSPSPFNGKSTSLTPEKVYPKELNACKCLCIK